jgi:hypothetical protein
MNHNEENLDARVRGAFGDAPPVSGGDSLLDPGVLNSRSPQARNPRRVKKVAAGSLLGVGSLALVGVLVTTLTLPSQAHLFTLADSGGGQGAAEMATSDRAIGIWTQYEYLAGEGLGTEGGRGDVYQLELEGTPQGVLASLGERLGVPGVPTESEYFDPQWPLYVLGAEDWTAPSINVTWNGTGNWYYNNPAAYPDPVCTEVPGSADGTEPGYFDCVTPEPSGPLVSPEEARAQAVELFGATGLSVSAGDIRVLTNDEWGVGVAAALRVGGVDTALEWTMFWAPGPILASASGHAVTITNRGSFDTVSPVVAVDRLASGMWWGAPSPSYYSDFGVAIEARDSGVEDLSSEEGAPVTEPVTPAPDEPVSSDDPVEGQPGVVEPGTDEPGEEPVPLPEPLPEPIMPDQPEIVTVTVTSSEPTLLLVWDAAGNAWLVPGYVLRYGDDDWSWSAVISVVEGVIEIPEPQLVGILPMPEPYIEE